MRSAEHPYGIYAIKTFLQDGEYRARAFHNGLWLRTVSDWTGTTLEDVLRQMQKSLDALEPGELRHATQPSSLISIAADSVEVGSA